MRGNWDGRAFSDLSGDFERARNRFSVSGDARAVAAMEPSSSWNVISITRKTTSRAGCCNHGRL
jgi:hypothetical protein